MGFELGEYHDKGHLKEMIDEFSPAQLESLHHFMKILDKGFTGTRGPEGKVIRGFINMDVERTGERTTTATLPLRWELYNGAGVIHGGITATFIDNAMGRTLYMSYPGEIMAQVTTDLNIRYLKGGKGSKLTAHTELVQAGGSLAVLQCSVRDDQGDLMAIASGTFRIWPKKDK